MHVYVVVLSLPPPPSFFFPKTFSSQTEVPFSLRDIDYPGAFQGDSAAFWSASSLASFVFSVSSAHRSSFLFLMRFGVGFFRHYCDQLL